FTVNAGVIANPIVLASRTTATGTITIGIPGGSVGATLSGGVTGDNDLVINNSTIGVTGRPNFPRLANNSGTVTLICTNSGPTGLRITQNSATTQLTVPGVNALAGSILVKAGTLSGITSGSAFGTGPIPLVDASVPNSSAVRLLGAGLTFANPIALGSPTNF